MTYMTLTFISNDDIDLYINDGCRVSMQAASTRITDDLLRPMPATGRLDRRKGGPPRPPSNAWYNST